MIQPEPSMAPMGWPSTSELHPYTVMSAVSRMAMAKLTSSVSWSHS